MPDALSEIDDLMPEVTPFKFSNGVQAEVLPLQTRQLFRLLRVLTHGAGVALRNAPLDFTQNIGEFGSQLAMMVVISIPDAEQEFLDFLVSMCRPAGLPEGKLNRQDRERVEEAWAELRKVLNNPDPNDLIDLVDLIVRRDAAQIQSLGKRLWVMLEPLLPAPAKTPELEDQEDESDEPPDEPPGVQAGSPPPSTSSPPSTGGATTRSSPSRSAASSKSSQLSPAAEAMTSAAEPA